MDEVATHTNLKTARCARTKVPVSLLRGSLPAWKKTFQNIFVFISQPQSFLPSTPTIFSHHIFNVSTTILPSTHPGRRTINSTENRFFLKQCQSRTLRPPEDGYSFARLLPVCGKKIEIETEGQPKRNARENPMTVLIDYPIGYSILYFCISFIASFCEQKQNGDNFGKIKM